MDFAGAITQISILALPVLFAITLHEAAHGYVARHFGDLTAYQAGRISLNPLRHIDPIGTVLVPLVVFFTTGFLFGWAKPVPVNFSRLRHPKKDMLWVAAAGPAANLFMAILWIFVAGLVNPGAGSSMAWLFGMAQAGLMINLILMVLNLLPLPPLDGGRIAVSLLPNPYAYRFSQIEPYGLIILVVLLVSGVLGRILGPIVNGVGQLLLTLFGS